MLKQTSGRSNSTSLKVVQLTTDNREPFRQYDRPEPWFGAAPEALLQGFADLPEVEVHVVTCTQQPVRAPEKLAGNIWFHSLHVPKTGWLRTGYQGCIRAIRRRIHEIVPDIVHGQGTERECALGAVFSGFPNVITIHGNMASMIRHQDSAFASFYSRCAALLETIALRLTQGVLCNSAYTESLVRRHCQKTWRVPNALRKAFFDKTRDTPAGGIPVLLNIGTVAPWKGQVALLDLACGLHASGAKFDVNFVGGLDERSPYGRAFCEKLRTGQEAGYARCLGTLGVDELIALMDSASALVHLPQEEAFGLVVAEALARNLKVFATKTGGVVDIATGVDGAELFASSARPEMAAAILSWLANGAPRPTLAANVMRARYWPEVIARRHLEIYRDVLKINH